MVRNSYVGVLDDWKVRLIRDRARRRGFQGQDLDDAIQQIAMAVLRFRFDESRPERAKEATVLTAIVDRQLAMIRRRESRWRRRDQLAASQRESTYCHESKTELVAAVRRVVGGMSPAEQRICGLLVEGRSTRGIAESCGVSWHTAAASIERIRRRFESSGLGQFVDREEGVAS